MEAKAATTPTWSRQTRYEVSPRDLPVCCPMPGSNWNAHPRVYLPLGEVDYARCPYCGTEYLLKQ